MTETLDFSHITLGDRPLVVCDIDEVVLEFVTPFGDFLRATGHDLLPRSFRLHGNVVDRETGHDIADTAVTALLERFFATHDEWQTPAAYVGETLAGLSEMADIVFLTAIPPRHARIRRALLDRHGLTYPLLASEEPKGPIVRRLHDARAVPLVFIDDILRNLQSVQTHAPDCLLINLMANDIFRSLAPEPREGIVKARTWPDAARIIHGYLHRQAGRVSAV